MSKYQFVLVKSNSLIKPSPRSGHRCVTDDTYLYVFGGFNPGTTKKLFSEIWCFNLSLQTWHKLETSGPSPTCVASSTVVLRRGKLVIFGGSGYPFGSNNSNRTYVCDLRMRKWKELSIGSASNETPEESYGQCGVIGPDNCMYVFGGTKGLEYNNNLHKMNLDSYSWEWIRCRIVPSPRYRHEAVSIDDAFLVIGGYGQNGACTLEKVYMFKYDQNVWKEVKCLPYNDSEFPKPRRAHSCIRYKKNVYVCGGYTEVQSDVDESCAYDDVWKLDLKTFCWQRINQVPKQISWLTFTISTAKVILMKWRKCMEILMHFLVKVSP